MAKFQKGHKKIGGRTLGTPDKKTELWNNLGNFFTQEGAERAMKIMMTSKDKEFMIYYKDLIELFKPKQSRVESNIEFTDTSLKVNRTITTKELGS